MRCFSMVFCVVAVLAYTIPVAAEEGTCAICGQPGACKTCRLVLKERKVEVVCWGIKRDPVCVPGCSERGCKHCEEACAADANSEICNRPRTFKWIEWRPAASAKLYMKNKLMKKVEVHKVPAYEWVAEDLCPHCQEACAHVEIHAGADIPKPPAVAAKFLNSEQK